MLHYDRPLPTWPMGKKRYPTCPLMAHFCGAIDTWTDETDPSRRDGDIFHEVSLYQRDRSKDKTRSASVKRRKRIFKKLVATNLPRPSVACPSYFGIPFRAVYTNNEKINNKNNLPSLPLLTPGLCVAKKSSPGDE